MPSGTIEIYKYPLENALTEVGYKLILTSKKFWFEELYPGDTITIPGRRNSRVISEVHITGICGSGSSCPYRSKEFRIVEIKNYEVYQDNSWGNLYEVDLQCEWCPQCEEDREERIAYLRAFPTAFNCKCNDQGNCADCQWLSTADSEDEELVITTGRLAKKDIKDG